MQIRFWKIFEHSSGNRLIWTVETKAASTALRLLVLLEEMHQDNPTHRPLMAEVYETLQTITRQTDRAAQEFYVGTYLSRSDTPISWLIVLFSLVSIQRNQSIKSTSGTKGTIGTISITSIVWAVSWGSWNTLHLECLCSTISTLVHTLSSTQER